MNRWIDIHTHLDMLEVTAEQALADAKAVGVDRVITIGTSAKDHQRVLDFAHQYNNVFCTLGVHPHDASTYDNATEEFIVAHVANPKVVAIGEIGLDYYYNHSPQDVQKEVFIKQLELAKKYQLPVEIHTRDAEADTIDILKNFKTQVRGVLHCFTGTDWLARQALDLGFDLSFSGVVTFKSADELRKVCQWAPLDRIHVETDAPFLAPIPMRGKKNVPAYVVHTAEAVSRIKGIALEELADRVGANAEKLFYRLKTNDKLQF